MTIRSLNSATVSEYYYIYKMLKSSLNDKYNPETYFDVEMYTY